MIWVVRPPYTDVKQVKMSKRTARFLWSRHSAIQSKSVIKTVRSHQDTHSVRLSVNIAHHSHNSSSRLQPRSKLQTIAQEWIVRQTTPVSAGIQSSTWRRKPLMDPRRRPFGLSKSLNCRLLRRLGPSPTWSSRVTMIEEGTWTLID